VAFGEITIALLAVPSGRGVIDNLLHQPPLKQTTIRPVPLSISLVTTHPHIIQYTLLIFSLTSFLTKALFHVHIYKYKYMCVCARVRVWSILYIYIYIYIYVKENIRNKTQTVTTVAETKTNLKSNTQTNRSSWSLRTKDCKREWNGVENKRTMTTTTTCFIDRILKADEGVFWNHVPPFVSSSIRPKLK
jgi:hypothetical protein